MRILVIEDNHDMRVCLRQMLEDSRYKVYTVANGKDALVFLENNLLPDLIVLDVNMPIMNGEEFLIRLRGSVKFCAIPTLIVSGDLDGDLQLANAFLVKPIEVHSFMSEVGLCLRGSPSFNHP